MANIIQASEDNKPIPLTQLIEALLELLNNGKEQVEFIVEAAPGTEVTALVSGYIAKLRVT